MPSQYLYRTTVRNEYLGVSKVIRAMTRQELDWLVDAQLAKWGAQERRRRETKAKERDRTEARHEAAALQAGAEADTAEAQTRIAEFRGLLVASLGMSLTVDWQTMLDSTALPPFTFKHPKPDINAIRRKLLGPEPVEASVTRATPPEPSFLETFLPFLRRKRLAREEEIDREYARAVKRAKADYRQQLSEYKDREKEVANAYQRIAAEYTARMAAEKAAYDRERDAFLAKQKAHNDAVNDFRRRYEAGSAEAVERYAQMALERSAYPEGVPAAPEVQFDAPSKTLIVNFWLPGPEAVPNVVEYRFVASRKAVKSVEMKTKDFEPFYDDVLHQIALRTMSEVHKADYACHVAAVVFNGCVEGLDRKTGKEFKACILSCEIPREKFAQLDLARVSPKDCVRSFKGITAGPLALLAPVRPIMDLDRNDDRFVESRDVLDRLRPEDNLAAMEWEDFEHLVRELFGKEFAGSGGEVRVTQTSRDRGVDAIAFDPDPIRGGKFVIQAKRYNMVVPVSAVRDLYGTMIAEGAVKGILVTTSHFGRDSREFAKDKPITLLDGENLIYLFQKHGRAVHIQMLPKGDPRRGL